MLAQGGRNGWEGQNEVGSGRNEWAGLIVGLTPCSCSWEPGEGGRLDEEGRGQRHGRAGGEGAPEGEHATGSAGAPVAASSPAVA